MKEDRIEGGAFQVARKIFKSSIWLDKPSSWKIIWIYIFGNVNHKTTKYYERGEGFFNFTDECKKIGQDITPDMIKKFLQYGRRMAMLSTKRSTRGLTLKVLNYNTYQELFNYKSTTSSTKEAREKHSDKQECSKNDKNVKKEEKNSLLENERESIRKAYLEKTDRRRVIPNNVNELVASIGNKGF